MWVGSFGVCFGGGSEGGGYLRLVKIMLETWNLVSTPTYVVSENIPFSTKALILQKNQHFLVKMLPLIKAIVWELCWRFLAVFSFSLIVTINIQFNFT